MLQVLTCLLPSAPFSVLQVRFWSTRGYSAGHIQAWISALFLSQLISNYRAVRLRFRFLLLCFSTLLRSEFEAETRSEQKGFGEGLKVSRSVDRRFGPSRVTIIQISTSVVKTFDNIITSRLNICNFTIIRL